MGGYIEIIGHDSVTVETSTKNIAAAFYQKGNCIRFFNGTVVGVFPTAERAAEVLNDLKQAAIDGEESFTLPEE